MARRKVFGLFWLVLAAVFAFVIAGGVSNLIRKTPWSWEKKIAEQLPAPESCSTSAKTKAALENLIKRLYPLDQEDHKFSIHVQIVKSSEVNAFASLGGEIYINNALLEKAHSADEVAGVLAHEIAHVQNRDLLEGVFSRLLLFSIVSGQGSAARIGADLMNMKFTSSQEQAADEGALRRLKLAKIDAKPFAEFFDRLEKESSGSVTNILSDHPPSKERAEMARATLIEDAKPALSNSDWKALAKACE